jgi:branched-chain amino acid transport system permease protein
MTPEQMFFQTFVNGIVMSSNMILIASGLCLIFGTMHIINFAHGEFYMLGGFGAWVFFGNRLVSLGTFNVASYVLSIVLTMIIVALLGIIVEKLIFRRFRKNLTACIITAFGILLILQALALIVFGIQDKAFTSPFVGRIDFGGISISKERFAVVICAWVFIGAMYFFIQRTKWGKAMRAVAQDTEAASVQGINIGFTYSLAMGIGCALAAAGGALMGPIYYVNPYMGVESLVKAFAVIILGGMGSLPGAVIGGFIVGMTESFVSSYVGAHMALVVLFVILIGVLLIRPTGILGHEN